MKYEKPLIFLNDTRAESVYMLSGTISDAEISDIGNTTGDTVAPLPDADNSFSDGPSGNGSVSGDIGEFSDGATGGADSSGNESGNTVKCDSIYMQGVWQGPDYSGWNGATRGYRQQFGCLGCPAYRWDGCGLLSDYVASGSASSYDADNGNRKPSWEKKGYGPDNTVTDWNM